jgi:phosphonate transport system substrate-binding protein
MYSVYEYITRRLAGRLGRPAELSVGTRYESLVEEVDIAFVCGLAYVELADRDAVDVEPLAAPVLRGPRYRGRPVYFSDVIVRRDSPFHSFENLRGCSWAYNEPHSHSGYGVTRYRLAELGEGDGYFGRVVQSGWHERSIRMVCAGEVDASAIDAQVLAVAMRDDPELALQLRVIESLGPSTIQPVVAARRLPAAVRQAVRAELLTLGDDPLARSHLAHGFIERFVPIEDADYDDIRRMRRTADAVLCGALSQECTILGPDVDAAR